MNLAEIASREQEYRGKMSLHVTGLAIAKKEVAKHEEAIAEIGERLTELEQEAQARFAETRALAGTTAVTPQRQIAIVVADNQAEPAPEPAPEPTTDALTAEERSAVMRFGGV